MPYKSYDINFDKLSAWLIARWALVADFIILVSACMYPFALIHNAFIRYRDAKLYELYINGQVCYLEAFLNDRFDYTSRRIYIEDVEIVEPVYLYTRAETRPLWLYTRSELKPVHIYSRGESLGDQLNDFVVYVPLDINLNEPEMRAMIANNLCGKRYKIERF